MTRVRRSLFAALVLALPVCTAPAAWATSATPPVQHSKKHSHTTHASASHTHKQHHHGSATPPPQA